MSPLDPRRSSSRSHSPTDPSFPLDVEDAFLTSLGHYTSGVFSQDDIGASLTAWRLRPPLSRHVRPEQTFHRATERLHSGPVRPQEAAPRIGLRCHQAPPTTTALESALPQPEEQGDAQQSEETGEEQALNLEDEDESARDLSAEKFHGTDLSSRHHLALRIALSTPLSRAQETSRRHPSQLPSSTSLALPRPRFGHRLRRRLPPVLLPPHSRWVQSLPTTVTLAWNCLLQPLGKVVNQTERLDRFSQNQAVSLALALSSHPPALAACHSLSLLRAARQRLYSHRSAVSSGTNDSPLTTSSLTRPVAANYLEYMFGTMKCFNGRNSFVVPSIVRITFGLHLGPFAPKVKTKDGRASGPVASTQDQSRHAV
ncbi:hypothetical protein V8E36_008857 [Tilletia maclaganii]